MHAANRHLLNINFVTSIINKYSIIIISVVKINWYYMIWERKAVNVCVSPSFGLYMRVCFSSHETSLFETRELRRIRRCMYILVCLICLTSHISNRLVSRNEKQTLKYVLISCTSISHLGIRL